MTSLQQLIRRLGNSTTALLHLLSRVLGVVALAGVMTLVSGQSAIASDKPAARVLVLGDSIGAAYGMAESNGWVYLMDQELDAKFGQVDTHNASLSGETTTGGLQRLPGLLNKYDPDVVIIELGGNDGLRGQSLKQMAGNLTDMVNLTLDAGAIPLLLGMRIPSNYGPVYTERFASTYTDVAGATGAAVVPFLLEPIVLQREYFLPDGVHPAQNAQPLLAAHIQAEITRLIEAVTGN